MLDEEEGNVRGQRGKGPGGGEEGPVGCVVDTLIDFSHESNSIISLPCPFAFAFDGVEPLCYYA